MTLLMVLTEEGPRDSVLFRDPRTEPLLISALLVAAGAALYWRRRQPATVLAVILGCWAMALGTDHADAGGAALVAVYATGRHAADDLYSRLAVAAAAVVLVTDGITGPLSWGETGFGVVVFFGAWYVGRRLRMRAERLAAMERERAAEARRIVVEERTRIARELHDVVAHRVSLMTIQAGAAQAVVAHDPTAAARAMAAVEEAGRQALDELRHLLGVLRPDADPSGLGPQPGLAELPRLVESMRDAGVDVSLTADDLPAGLPTRVDLSAYRIVQESLTNVLKHAGPGTRAAVRLRQLDGNVEIEVSDDGRGGSTLPGTGHGVIGMRERALLLGGSLAAGPRAEGGYRVSARLPVEGGSR